jgi:hypothetical protein
MPTTVKKSKGRPQRYQWSKWADGDWWETTGTKQETERFRSAAYKAAERMGKVLDTEFEGNTLYFRFLDQSADRGSR